DGILYLGDVEHPEGSGLITDTDFPYPFPYARHRLPVARLKALLNLVELDASLFTRRLGKSPQLLKGVPDKFELLHVSHAPLYQNLYSPASRRSEMWCAPAILHLCTMALPITEFTGGSFPAVKLVNGPLDKLRVVEAETRPQ